MILEQSKKIGKTKLILYEKNKIILLKKQTF